MNVTARTSGWLSVNTVAFFRSSSALSNSPGNQSRFPGCRERLERNLKPGHLWQGGCTSLRECDKRQKLESFVVRKLEFVTREPVPKPEAPLVILLFVATLSPQIPGLRAPVQHLSSLHSRAKPFLNLVLRMIRPCRKALWFVMARLRSALAA